MIGEFEGETPIEGLVSHPFEIEINVLVKVNHELTIAAIGQLEQDGIAEARENFEDRDLVDSLIREHEVFCDDLRKAANHLAAVGLVTRFQHCIEALVKKPCVDKPAKTPRLSKLCSDLEKLNASLGDGPVPVDFFDQLVTARDSIIHADSKTTWEHRGTRREIASCYRNFAGEHGELEMTEAHLSEAVEKAIAQVKWYTAKLPATDSAT